MSNWFQDISNATVEVLVWSSTHDPLLEMSETKQITKALLAYIVLYILNIQNTSFSNLKTQAGIVNTRCYEVLIKFGIKSKPNIKLASGAAGVR